MNEESETPLDLLFDAGPRTRVPKMCVAFADSGGLHGIMALIAAALLLTQEPFQDQIDEALRQFDAAVEVDQALALLSAQLAGLGTQASSPIARRLALDLRDGMASAAAPAFIDALVGRPDALVPLQTAFRDATTSAAGRIELAEALLQLDDAMSWRGGLVSIAADEQASLTDRLHASKVLLEAEDGQVAALLRALVDTLPSRPPEEQRRIAEFLRSADTPLTRGLLARIAGASSRGTDEPVVEIVDDPEPPPLEAAFTPPPKKKETRGATFFTMPSIVAGGVTLVLLVLLAVEILRKG